MGQTVRFGVSIDADLLADFDELCARHGYENRSEALRDCIRAALVEDPGSLDAAHSAGTLTLVYDHHKSDLAQKLTEEQHEAHDLIVAVLHVHLDHHHCLEVMVLRGPGTRIAGLARRLLSIKGVLHGKFIFTGAGTASGPVARRQAGEDHDS
jgi:CopG family nickel-responsive transcriptional regulator